MWHRSLFIKRPNLALVPKQKMILCQLLGLVVLLSNPNPISERIPLDEAKSAVTGLLTHPTCELFYAHHLHSHLVQVLSENGFVQFRFKDSEHTDIFRVMLIPSCLTPGSCGWIACGELGLVHARESMAVFT